MKGNGERELYSGQYFSIHEQLFQEEDIKKTADEISPAI